MEKETKEICNFLVNAIIIGLIALFAAINYQTGLNLKKQNEGIEKQLWDIRLKHYGFYNETKDWIAFHQYYFNSTVVALKSTDEALKLTLAKELPKIENALKNLEEEYNSLVVLLEKLDSKTDVNAESINMIKQQIVENIKTITEIRKKSDLILSALYKHVSQKKGLFKKFHDENTKKQLE